MSILPTSIESVHPISMIDSQATSPQLRKYYTKIFPTCKPLITGQSRCCSGNVGPKLKRVKRIDKQRNIMKNIEWSTYFSDILAKTRNLIHLTTSN